MKPYQGVLMYQTWDGKLHTTTKDAVKHVENTVGTDLRKLVTTKVSNYKQASELVLHMLENHSLYQSILSRLTAFEEEHEDEK